MNDINEKINILRQHIIDAAEEFGRDPQTISLLAVSKKQSLEKIRAAHASGLDDFGENYLQEALQKQQQLSPSSIRWHFIGPIQSNKSKAIAQHFDWVHTVSRLDIAEKLHKSRPLDCKPLNICIQININAEATKSGIELSELEAFARSLLTFERLKLRGLMVIPEPTSDFEQQVHTYQQVEAAMAQLNQVGFNLDTLSMGMSNDYRAAIACGATIIRIGSALFGERQK